MKRLLAAAILVSIAGPASAQLDALQRPFDRRRAPAAFPAAARPHPAVCRIVVPNPDGTSFGTGTLVDVRGRHGLVLTNWHVVHEASGPIEVVFPDGFRSPGHVHKVDKDWDLAALAIYRPAASPVPLSRQVPREGDPLTIAGYGQGDYRAVTGRCMQFLAPGDNQPFEILELGAAARQGDSGGPIFNARGELAGVLFGEGDGRTCGSHCGRVGRFLGGVLPVDGAGSAQAQVAARPPERAFSSGGALVHEEPLEPVGGAATAGGAARMASASSNPAAAALDTGSDASQTWVTRGDPLSDAADLAAAQAPEPAVLSAPESNRWTPDSNAWTPEPAAGTAEASGPAAAPPAGAILSAEAAPAAAPAPRPGPAWLYSPAVEIAKHVLAGVGVLAILGHLLRALFGRKTPAKGKSAKAASGGR